MVNWETTAFIFPGQGSQEVGMGKDFADQYQVARETFEEADDKLGFSLSKMCWDGSESELNQTMYTQPAIYVTSMAIYRVLKQEIPDANPSWVAGHSLGEFSALTAAGVMSYADGVKLVNTRGSLMQKAGEDSPGSMAALLALDTDQVLELCKQVEQETSQTVVLANDNCPGQIVVSGDIEAIDRLIEVAADAGAKRAVKLAVSIASHSPLMKPAAEAFKASIDAIQLHEPVIPVYGNVTAAPLQTVAEIRTEIENQITQTVRWTESMNAIIEQGAETFIEVGSKDVLAGLMKRIDRKKSRISLNSVEALQNLIG